MAVKKKTNGAAPHNKTECVAAFRAELERHVSVHEGYHKAKDEQLLLVLDQLFIEMKNLRTDVNIRITQMEADIAELKRIASLGPRSLN